MPDVHPLFLMLIKVASSVMTDKDVLIEWIDEIEDDYMQQFGALGASVAHLHMEDGPWHFALLFPGSPGSVNFLENAIQSKASGTEILTMRAIDLDDFRAQ